MIKCPLTRHSALKKQLQALNSQNRLTLLITFDNLDRLVGDRMKHVPRRVLKRHPDDRGARNAAANYVRSAAH